MTKKDAAFLEAAEILKYLQNIDAEEAIQFAETWLKAINAGRVVQGEEEIDSLLFIKAIAETDRRFEFGMRGLWDDDSEKEE